MKKLVLLLAGLLLLMLLIAVACNQAPMPEETSSQVDDELVSSCETCHTDKALLQQTVSTEISEKPEEASGEG